LVNIRFTCRMKRGMCMAHDLIAAAGPERNRDFAAERY
jgi:hypothetical protein